MSPSGKARGFGSRIHRFESGTPCHFSGSRSRRRPRGQAVQGYRLQPDNRRFESGRGLHISPGWSSRQDASLVRTRSRVQLPLEALGNQVQIPPKLFYILIMNFLSWEVSQHPPEPTVYIITSNRSMLTGLLSEHLKKAG